MFESVTKKEWIWVLVVSLVVMFVTILPYLYGYFITPADKVFAGLHTINSGDTYSYLSWIEQSRQGDFLFKILYSSELQPRIFFHPLFLILGKIGAITGLSNIVIFHGSRFVLGVLFLFLSYVGLSKVFELEIYRKLGLVLIATSSGLGWFFGLYSTDLWMVESVSFLNLYESVINTFSLILVLGVFLLALKYFDKPLSKVIFFPVFLLNILILTHPYDGLLVFFILGLYSLYRLCLDFKDLNFIGNFVWLVLLSFPSIIWNAYVLYRNPVVAIWANFQTNMPSPSVIWYLMGFGFLLFLSMMTVVLYRKNYRIKNLDFYIVWLFVVLLLLIYNPLFLRFQRKFTEGVHIPMVILSVGFIQLFLEKLDFNKWQRYIFFVGVVVISLLSNVNVVSNDIRAYAGGGRPYYFDDAEKHAVDYLGLHTSSEDVILSGSFMGNIIPGLIGRTVYVGHGDQTVDPMNKSFIAEKILTAKPKQTDSLLFFLKDNGIDYIFIDNDLSFVDVAHLQSRPFLNLVFSENDVRVFQVVIDK